MQIFGRSLRRRIHTSNTKLHTAITELRTSIMELGNRLSRMRYFRGHGVHSPFVYNLVRGVFMRTNLLCDDAPLCHELSALGVAPCRCIQLQNLLTLCDYKSYSIDKGGADFVILTPALNEFETLNSLDHAAKDGITVAILYPTQGVSRAAMCRHIIDRHRSTTVDNRAYLLIFNGNLPKQHYQI